MTKRLNIISDYDNTIVDILPDWCLELKCEGFEDCDPASIKVYNMAANPCLAGVTEAQLMDTLTRVTYITRKNNVPIYTPWVAGVTEHLPQLAKQHDFTFVSCQPVAAERQTANKQLRLRAILPDAVVNYHDSSALRIAMDADVLIDDRADTVWEWCQRHPAGLGLLVAAPYNSEAELAVNMRRVADWGEIAAAIGEFAASAPVLGYGVTAPSAPAPSQRTFGLPADSDPARKSIDPFNGFLGFFPDAIAEAARISTTAGLKYNAGKTQWLTDKGGDRNASMGRHLMDLAKMRGKLGEPGWAVEHGKEAVAAYAALIWDASAALQLLIEALNAANKGDK